MRLRLDLRLAGTDNLLPINYQYPLSAAIYSLLRRAAPEYADWLHERGYLSPSGKLLKLFTFSRLWIPDVRRHDDRLRIPPGAAVQLYVSSPMLHDFITGLVEALFLQQQVTVGDRKSQVTFRVAGVTVLPEPEFSSPQRFRCLSPIALKTLRDHQGALRTYYYRPTDPELSDAIRRNLANKHATAYGERLDSAPLEFRLESSDRPRSRLVTLKAGTAEETHVKAFETWFTLQGDLRLIRTAYECGIGNYTAQGFGMVEVVHRRTETAETGFRKRRRVLQQTAEITGNAQPGRTK